MPDSNEPDALLEAFLEFAAEQGLALYDHQEDAILALCEGQNVILNTPTGSGKSLVALAFEFFSIARQHKAYYTAPIKALVNEKFFELCAVLGPDNVGLMTGDASVNTCAPVICCTGEILSNLALREGASLNAHAVIIDEFHFYGDRERGMAWQVPLLTLPQARFLLMSATLGDAGRFVDYLTELTGAPTALVTSNERPVPLDFEYRISKMQSTLLELKEKSKLPAYVVHFTQRAATESAQDFMSVDFLTKDEKHAIREQLKGTRFDTAFGKELRRLLEHGLGVHHAGLLPRYRRAVEKLAQEGLLKVICGTDTLGVGVNVPIRTVVFSQLCKYDGSKTRVLRVRDFQQIAGRAGRRGFDTHGSVVVQAPLHEVENQALKEKAGSDPKKQRKLKFKKPPERGYKHWDSSTMEKLVAGPPETLTSRFTITQSTVLEVMSRPDGCAALRHLIRSSHERRYDQRQHARKAISILRALIDAGVIQKRDGGYFIDEELQRDFSLHHGLSLYAIEAIEALDPEDVEYPLNVVSVIEATLEDPHAVLRRQLDTLRQREFAKLKAEGMPYEERQAKLDKLRPENPLEDYLLQTARLFCEKHPWVADEIRPKNIVRIMYSEGLSFRGLVKEYGLARSEGVLLRYLSQVYKGLKQNVPENLMTDETDEVIEWLALTIRSIDSSILDEWMMLTTGTPAKKNSTVDLFEQDNKRALVAMIRNASWRIVTLLARKQYDQAAELCAASAERLENELGPYFDEYDAILIDANARAPKFTELTSSTASATWHFEQVLSDPCQHHGWRLRFSLDISKAKSEREVELALESIERA